METPGKTEAEQITTPTDPPAAPGDGTPPASPGRSWIRKTVMFLAGQSVSLFGSSLVQYAIIWYITLETQSGTMIMLSSLCGFAPQIAITLFAGVWADRFDRKRIIILADTLIAVATLVLAMLFLLGHGQLWMLLAASAVRSFGAGLQQPAVGAFIPQIVPQEKLMRVAGINGTIQSAILLLSPVVSGALFALSRLEYIFFIDVGTAAIAITIMVLLKVPPHKKAMEAPTGGYFDDLKAGFAYIRCHSFVKSLLVFFAMFSFLIVPAAFLTPLMVARTFGPEVWRLTVIEILFSGGMTAGGLIVAVWGGFKERATTIAVTCVLFGALSLVLGLFVYFWFFLAVMLLMGLLIPFFNTASMVMLQERVENDYQGRVFSFVNIVMVSSMPIGTMVFGPIADRVNIELLMIVSGAATMLLGVWAWFDKNLKGYGPTKCQPDGQQGNQV